MGHFGMQVEAEQKSIYLPSQKRAGKTLHTSGPQPYQPYEGEDYHLPYFQQLWPTIIRMNFIVVCETCAVFYFLPSASSKFQEVQNKNQICRINLTELSVLHMQYIQCFICGLPSASYVVYSMLHMQYTQCFVCDLFSASYVVDSVLHMRPIQCLLCDLSSASYVIYSVPLMRLTEQIVYTTYEALNRSNMKH